MVRLRDAPSRRKPEPARTPAWSIAAVRPEGEAPTRAEIFLKELT